MNRPIFNKEFFLKVITDWKRIWMSQHQNSPEDYENYQRRAAGVDANMKHSLAIMLAKAVHSEDKIDVSEAKPQPGKIYLCVLKNYRRDKDIYQVHRLKAVFQDDCEWRTADDNSKINYDWDVVHWQEESI